MNLAMKRTISVVNLVLTFFLLLSPLSAQEAGGSSVWRVSRGGSTLYLAGSVHLLRERDFPLPEEFDRAFSLSSVLVLEADIAEMQNEGVLLYLFSQMMLEDGKTLESLLDAETYALLAEKTAAYGIPIEALSGIKPSLVVLMLSMLQIEELGFTQQGIDFYFHQRALDENKPMAFLESVETQINTIISMGEGYEDEYILYSLSDMEETELELEELIHDWRTGEFESSDLTLITMKEEWPLLYKALITDRHDAWMPQIEAFLDSGRVHFVVVGLLHVHGPDGLLRRLQDRGYTIERFR